MQEYRNSFNGLWGKLPRKRKMNDMEAACALLSNKLYTDYVDAFGKFPGVEPEHFAEEWMRKCIPDNDQIMKRSIWGHFLCRLVERKNGRV